MNKRTTIFIILLFIITAAMSQPVYEEKVPYDATHYLNGYQQCYFYMNSNRVDVYPTIGGIKHEFRFGLDMKEKFYHFFFSGDVSNEQKSIFLQRLLDESIHFPPPNSSFFSPERGIWEPFYGYTNILIHNLNNDVTWLVPEYFRCNINPTDDGIILNVINSMGSIMFTYGTDQRNQLAYYLNSELGKQEKAAYLHKFIEAELKSPSSTTSIVPAGQNVMQNYAEYIDKKSPKHNDIDKAVDKVTEYANKSDGLIFSNKSGNVNKSSEGTKSKENSSSSGSGGIIGILILLYIIYKVANRKKNKTDNRATTNVNSSLSDYNRHELEEKEQKARKKLERQMKQEKDKMLQVEKERQEKIARQEQKKRREKEQELKKERERQEELERKKKETERKEKERRRREDEERDRERRDREKRRRREEERRKKEYEDRLYDEYRRQQGL